MKKNTETSRKVYRADYRPPEFLLDGVALEFIIADQNTTVRSRLALVRNPANPAADLRLDGSGLELQSVLLDGKPLTPDRYSQDAGGLTVTDTPDRFTLETEVLDSWLGRRPSTPESLPVIGVAPRLPQVLCAFGHGHLGMTQGPASGRIIADLVAGRDPRLDLAPFSPGR